MGGEESRAGGSNETRLLFLRAQGCLVCLAVEVIDGIYDATREPHATISSVPQVGWDEVCGIEAPVASSADDRLLVVVRTRNGPIALRADEIVGIRPVSLVETPPIPGRSTRPEDRLACYLLLLDGRPHFFVEPAALARAGATARASSATALADARVSQAATGS